MKLIKKTQSVYLSLILLLLVVWGGVFLFFISSEIGESVDETLAYELELTIYNLKELRVRPNEFTNTTFFNVNQISKITDTTIVYTDTMITDPEDSDLEPFRQIRTQIIVQNQPYQIVFRKSQLEYDDLFTSILAAGIIFIGLLISIMAVINRQVLQKIWEPFYNTMEQLMAYNVIGSDSVKLKKTDIDEFKQLNIVIEEMLARIESEYQRLKQFTENASHEIQTPLAVIQNQIEMIIQDESIPQQSWDRLQVISSKVSKLSRLNKALLLLTKIENDQYAQREQVNISQILKKLVSEYKQLGSSKGIAFEEKMKPGVTCLINRDLAEILFRNLLSNAVKHNYKDGYIELTLTQDYLIISNTGPELTKDLSLMFDRFQKGSSDSDTLGLGLSIVYAIIKSANLEITYRFENGSHIIEISFNRDNAIKPSTN